MSVGGCWRPGPGVAGRRMGRRGARFRSPEKRKRRGRRREKIPLTQLDQSDQRQDPQEEAMPTDSRPAVSLAVSPAAIGVFDDMENIDTEVFEENIQATGKSIHVCRFCHRQFPYGLRGLHNHKGQCAKYPQHQQQLLNQQQPSDQRETTTRAASKSKRTNPQQPPSKKSRKPMKTSPAKQPAADRAQTKGMALASELEKWAEPLDEAFSIEKHEAICRYCHARFSKSKQRMAKHMIECMPRRLLVENTTATKPTPRRQSPAKRRQREQVDETTDGESTTRTPVKRTRKTGRPAAPPAISPLPSALSSRLQWTVNPTDHFVLFVRNSQNWMRCKYCGHQMSRRKGMGEKHLATCSELVQRRDQSQRREQQGGKRKSGVVLKVRGTHGQPGPDDIDRQREKVLGELMELHQSNPTSKSSVHDDEDNVENEEEDEVDSGDEELEDWNAEVQHVREHAKIDDATIQSWLFGDLAGAQLMKESYRNQAFVLERPKERWDAVTHDYLHDLKLEKLVKNAVSLKNANVNCKLELVMDLRDRHAPVTEVVELHTVREALMLYDKGFSIYMDAPRKLFKLVVPFLARDLGVGSIASEQEHEAPLIFARSGCLINWQFHRHDVFVFCLRGDVVWRLKASEMIYPVNCCHPRSTSMDVLESLSKIHDLVGAAGKAFPPSEDKKSIKEVALQAGSVLYMPGGLWHHVDAQEDSVWMEVRIASTSYADLIVDGVRQLLWKDPQWRQGVLVSDLAKAHSHCGSLLIDLQQKVDELTPTDLLPESLVSETGDGLMENGDSEKHLQVDIGDYSLHAGQDLNLFSVMMFRQNPLAVLKSKEEVAMSLDQLDDSDEMVYLLNVSFGDATCRSKLRVHFRCNEVQSGIVQWIRSLQGASFRLLELFDAMRQYREEAQEDNATDDDDDEGHDEDGKDEDMEKGEIETGSSGRLGVPLVSDEELVRYVVRFLCWVGFISPIRIPPLTVAASAKRDKGTRRVTPISKVRRAETASGADAELAAETEQLAADATPTKTAQIIGDNEAVQGTKGADVDPGDAEPHGSAAATTSTAHESQPSEDDLRTAAAEFIGRKTREESTGGNASEGSGSPLGLNSNVMQPTIQGGSQGDEGEEEAKRK